MNKIVKHARKFCEAAFDLSETYNLNVTVLAVDHGGHLIALYRTDYAAFASIEAARRKAVAAACFQMPTAAQHHMFENDPLVMVAAMASGDLLIVPGGFPLILDNVCVGGVGIAGGHYREDQMLGEKALLALAGAEGTTP